MLCKSHYELSFLPNQKVEVSEFYNKYFYLNYYLLKYGKIEVVIPMSGRDNSMDMTTFIICVSIGTFSFTSVYWIKSFERKFRRDKTRRVDYFITKNKVNVDKFYSGVESDLIYDEETESIWYF